MDRAHRAKFILMGNSSTGKTSIIRTFIKEKWNPNTKVTVAMDVKDSTFTFDDTDMKVKIWDTCGQEIYRSVALSYIKSAKGLMIVFSKTDLESFEQCLHWIRSIRKLAPKNAIMILVGNKSDLNEEFQVDDEKIMLLSERENIKYFLVSAKTGVNIKTCFNYLAEKVFNLHYRGLLQPKMNQSINLDDNKDKKKESSTCCGSGNKYK